MLSELYPLQIDVYGDDEHKTISIMFATQADIDNITWPEKLIDIDMRHCIVDHVHIPDGVEYFTCSKGLKTLRVPDSMKRLYVENNMLVELEVPNTIKTIVANNNLLSKLVFRGGDGNPTDLEVLELRGNLFRTLDFRVPESLEDIDIKFNNWKTYDDIGRDIMKFVNSHDCNL